MPMNSITFKQAGYRINYNNVGADWEVNISEPHNTADYIIFGTDNDNDGVIDEVFAKNGRTGKIDFIGSNASAVIQRAIDELTSGGTIAIVSDLHIGSTIEIPNDNIIFTGSATLYSDITTYDDIISITGSNVKIINLTFANHQQGAGINIHPGASNVEVAHCVFKDFGTNETGSATPVYVGQGSGSYGEKVFIHDNYFTNVHTDACVGTSGKDIYVYSNIFDSVQLLANGNYPINVVIKNNIARNLNAGINISNATLLTIEGNTLIDITKPFASQTGTAPLKISDSSYVTISGNIIVNNMGTNYDGIYIENSSNVVITKNVIRSIDRDAVELISCSTVTVRENTFYSIDNRTIYADANTSSVVIEDNDSYSPRFGIEVAGNDILIRNNTILNALGDAVIVDTGASGISILENNVNKAITDNTGTATIRSNIGYDNHSIPSNAPPNPVVGSMYFDPSTGTLYVYDGSAWKSVALS